MCEFTLNFRVTLRYKQKILRKGGKNTQKKYIPPKKILMTQISTKNPPPRASHPGM